MVSFGRIRISIGHSAYREIAVRSSTSCNFSFSCWFSARRGSITALTDSMIWFSVGWGGDDDEFFGVCFGSTDADSTGVIGVDIGGVIVVWVSGGVVFVSVTNATSPHVPTSFSSRIRLLIFRARWKAVQRFSSRCIFSI